jgi:hypothetical protein
MFPDDESDARSVVWIQVHTSLPPSLPLLSLFPSLCTPLPPSPSLFFKPAVTRAPLQGKNFEQQQATVDAFLDMVGEDEVYDVYEEHTEGATARNIGNNQPQRDSGEQNFAIS